MKDGILKEMKNSRLLKAELPATYAELVALAANAGIPADVLFNATGWQQLPTFLNKKNLLQDSTAGLLGLTGDPTVDDAFVALLLTVKQMALVRVAVTVAGAPAIADIEVTGLEGLDGGAVYTDASGEAVGFAPAGEVSISTPTYQDLPAAPAVTRELAAGEIVDVALTIGSAPQAGDKSITSTTSGIRFSPYVADVDVCCVGAGGGGAINNTSSSAGAGGGGGGYVSNEFALTPDTKIAYTAVIGAGGPGAKTDSTSTGKAGSDGGTTTFMGVTANGGAGGRVYGGGAGNGNGGDGSGDINGSATAGKAGTVRAFDEPDGELFGGGGGGAYGYYRGVEVPGGASYGGIGNYGSGSLYRDGQGGQGPGGGGGAGWRTRAEYGAGGDGYRGEIRFRWRIA